MEKNDTQAVVLQSRKMLPDFRRNIFQKKKFLQLMAYLCRYDLQNNVRKVFLNKWVSRYLTFGYFKVPKNCSSQ